MRILVLHGPNLNLLGEREPKIYGTMTLAQINARLRKHARKRGVSLRIFQDNCEGTLIDLLHGHRKWAQGVVFNPRPSAAVRSSRPCAWPRSAARARGPTWKPSIG